MIGRDQQRGRAPGNARSSARSDGSTWPCGQTRGSCAHLFVEARAAAADARDPSRRTGPGGAAKAGGHGGVIARGIEEASGRAGEPIRRAPIALLVNNSARHATPERRLHGQSNSCAGQSRARMFWQRTKSAVDCTCALAGTQYLPMPSHEEDQHPQLRSRHALDAARDQPPDRPQSRARARADLARRPRAPDEDRPRDGDVPRRRSCIAQGALYEGDTVDSPRGRRPQMLYVRTHDRLVVAIDIRFSSTFIMLTDFSGNPIALEIVRHDQRPERARARAADARAASARRPTPAPRHCEGIGLVVPGMVDADHRTGAQRAAARVAQRRHPRPARGGLGLPVHVENAPIACALAQMWLGRPRRHRADRLRLRHRLRRHRRRRRRERPGRARPDQLRGRVRPRSARPRTGPPACAAATAASRCTRPTSPRSAAISARSSRRRRRARCFPHPASPSRRWSAARSRASSARDGRARRRRRAISAPDSP